MGNPSTPAQERTYSVQQVFEAFLPLAVGWQIETLRGIDQLGNRDGNINAADINEQNSEAQIASRYDTNIHALEQGMQERFRRLVTRFDANGDGHMTHQERTRLNLHLDSVLYHEAPVPDDTVLNTAQLLEAYDQALNHGLPPLPAQRSGRSHE